MHDPACGLGVLGRLIDDAHFTPPDRLGTLVADHAGAIGVSEAVIYLASVDQRTLRPLAGVGVTPREAFAIDGTLGGKAYREITPIETDGGGRRRMWVPLLDGTARLGLLEVVTDRRDDALETEVRQFAGVVSELIVSRSLYGDLFALLRRNRPMSLAAEMQWAMLPPPTFDDERITISGVLEPAYDIAGDSFDYSFNGDLAHFTILDAMGHGFEATLLSAVALAAYRHARRQGKDVADIYTAMDEAVSGQFGPEAFVTALIGQLNAETGQLRWVNGGHPPAMHVRRGRRLEDLRCDPSLPVGLGGAPAEVAEITLEPDDHVLFYTDGLVEARSADGEFFGASRVGEWLVSALNTGLPAAETARRLVHRVLAHHQEGFQDDAMAVLVQWHGPSS